MELPDLIRNSAILVICCIGVVKNEYCFMQDANPYPYLGRKTRYDVVRAKEMFIPSGKVKILEFPSLPPLFTLFSYQ